MSPGANSPADAIAFANELDAAERVVFHLLGAADARTSAYENQIVDVGRLALQPKTGINLTAGRAALESFREDFTTAVAEEVKRRFFIPFATSTATIAVAAGLLFILALRPDLGQISGRQNYFLLMVVACGASLLSYALRQPTFGELRPYRLGNAMLQAASNATFVFLLVLMCARKIATISVGGLSTDAIGADWISAVLLGAACGFSEAFVSKTVLSKLLIR